MFELRNISKTYKNTKILSDVSLSLKHGECLGIVGENGCGKSTLLRIVAGVDADFSGDILLDGKSILGDREVRKQKFAYVPQDEGLADFLTVAQQIEFWQKAIGQKNDEILSLLDIAEIAKKPIITLSGGQKKRLSIAMALQLQAELIIMDEAFAALDTNYRSVISDWIKTATKNGSAVLWCSHEQNEIDELCTACVRIKNGVIYSQK